MSLKENIQNDLRSGLKEKDENKTSTLKMLSAAIINKEIELQKKEEGLTDEEIQDVIRSEIKKRNDAIEAYEQNDRTEQAEKEKAELEILKAYLPPEISDEELEKTVKETIEQLEASSPQEFGKVMGALMPKLKGKASGNRISAKVKELLNS
jgi:uncharacterized protein YqeY